MLITCPECKKSASSEASFCPHCGLPFNSGWSKFKHRLIKGVNYRQMPNDIIEINKDIFMSFQDTKHVYYTTDLFKDTKINEVITRLFSFGTTKYDDYGMIMFVSLLENRSLENLPTYRAKLLEISNVPKGICGNYKNHKIISDVKFFHNGFDEGAIFESIYQDENNRNLKLANICFLNDNKSFFVLQGASYEDDLYEDIVKILKSFRRVGQERTTVPEATLPYFEEIGEFIIEHNYKPAIKLILKLAQNKEWDDKSAIRWLSVAVKGYVMEIQSEALRLQDEEDFIKATEKCKEVQELILVSLDVLSADKQGFALAVTEFVSHLPPQVNFQYMDDRLNKLLEDKKTFLDENTLFWLRSYLLMHIFPMFYGGLKKRDNTQNTQNN